MHKRFPKSKSHPLYNTWRAINKRCYQESHDSYPRYGGRGINVCEAWRTSFAAFVADMGPKPTKKHSIERIDNDGNYQPENCRWATNREQNRNRGNNHRITAAGRTQTIIEWAEEIGLPKTTLINRLLHGWTEPQTVGIEPRPRRRMEEELPKGWTVLAKRAGLSHQTVLRRVQIHGWSLEQALSTPVQSKPFTSAANNG